MKIEDFNREFTDARELHNSRFEQANRGIGVIWKASIAFIVLTFLFMLAWYTLIGYGVTKAVDHVSEHGLKSVVERVWEGPGGPKLPPPPKPVK